ncbi:MAG: DUF4917 family protein [Mediterranea sp.]|jgi:hypothetical protein|nr:DUF4917 family protein [Mediterranea sp.]
MEISDLRTYQEVVEELKKKERTKHLLLGNGFSIAYDARIFSYNALSTYIENSDNRLLRTLFQSINTKNFEIVMQQLDLLSNIAKVFKAEDKFITEIAATSDKLKSSLIEAVETMHPEHVFKIPEEKSEACCSFIEDYLANNGYVFSSNYDLLLYWVLMRNSSKDSIDGFGRDIENPLGDKYVQDYELEYSELRWGKYRDKQSLFYLHGALMLFDSGIDVIKEEYDGNFLLKNIKDRIDKKEYPIFVTGGTADDKLRHIMHNQYLSFCYDKLSIITGSLVTYGFSFGDNDDHIIKAINRAAHHKRQGDPNTKLASVYIGVYSDNDIKHIENIESKFECKINMYNARTANVWSKNE